jgi:branched-chain amino acid aminotransferase
MAKYVYMDGKLVEKDQAKVSVFDHGVLYGDGVFEGIRAYSGRVFKLDEHIDRLFNSAKVIMLDIPLSKDEFKAAIIQVCKANGIRDGYIRPVVTRGVGNLGLAPWTCSNPTVFIIADSVQLYPKEYYENGMPLVTVATRRNNQEALSPIVKSLNYLNNIMAKIEARNAGVEEAIMLNTENYVAECTGDNLFVIQGRTVYTPPIIAGVLPGITRATVMELARLGEYTVKERMITRAELFLSDEMFLTGSAAEVVPVVKVDGRIIGDGKPGPITRDLIERFHTYVNAHGTPIA